MYVAPDSSIWDQNWSHTVLPMGPGPSRELLLQNNQKENSFRIPHKYSVGDQVLVEQVVKTKFTRDKYMGPFKVLEVPGNGTLKLALEGYNDNINLHRIKPYVEPSNKASSLAEEQV